MARLNQERQKKLEPRRMEYAKTKLEELGFEVTKVSTNQLQFMHKGKLIKFFPYSGWASGSSIEDGRGIDNLLKQLK